MSENLRPPGQTTIAPDVLISIARMNALTVPGVSRLAQAPASVDRLFIKGSSDGVRIQVENDAVYADIYVILYRDFNVREVSRAIQNQVARAINELVGMAVGRINIHVEDIDTSETANQLP